jgi:hypothetical protein
MKYLVKRDQMPHIAVPQAEGFPLPRKPMFSKQIRRPSEYDLARLKNRLESAFHIGWFGSVEQKKFCEKYGISASARSTA